MKFRLLILTVFCFSTLFTLYAQTEETPAAEEKNKSYEAVPRGFNEVLLGLSLDDTKEKLKNDDNFYYTGDPDVSLLDRPNDTALDVEGTGYVYRGIFQFYEDSLYIISIMINPERMDHYSIFMHLSEKYGPPLTFSPSKSVWKQDGVMMVLERPVTIKYINEQTFNSIVDASEKEESLESELRRDFIEQF